MSRLIGRLAAALGFVGLVALAGYAIAQTAFPTPAGSSANGVVVMCPTTANAALYKPCSATDPLAVNATVSATITFPTFGAAFPATGIASGMSQGGNLVATTGTAGNLNVNCQVGCSGGSFNNNADGVATSATNGQVAAWLYGWNGTTWDRLKGDTTNGLFTNVKTSVLPTGAATSALQTTINATLGSPFQAGGSIGNTTFAVTQATAANLNATVVGTGTFAVQAAATQTGTWTVQPGNTANTTPWLFSPSTGGNTAAVKAASTAPVATDPALVVAISPNSVNANGQATMAASAPVVIASNQSSIAVAATLAAETTKNIGTTSQLPYPSGSTPYTATATGTTGATTATLAGASSVTTYLCGFSIRANATAAATGNATVTGVITATLNFTQWTAPNASGLGITEMIFAPCIPASGTNQSVAVVSAAPGTGGVVSVTAWGYKL